MVRAVYVYIYTCIYVYMYMYIYIAWACAYLWNAAARIPMCVRLYIQTYVRTATRYTHTVYVHTQTLCACVRTPAGDLGSCFGVMYAGVYLEQ